jgi:hypothetical protein
MIPMEYVVHFSAQVGVSVVSFPDNPKCDLVALLGIENYVKVGNKSHDE